MRGMAWGVLMMALAPIVLVLVISVAAGFGAGLVPAHAQPQAQGLALDAPPAGPGLRAPPAALPYRSLLRRQASMVWGLGAPVAVFAAQIHQESRWRPDARSPVGAQGLAQFMPTTANWLGGIDGDLAQRAPSNPTWALRAVVAYDRWLWQRVAYWADDCQRMAFVLSAYNGGLGWVYKRQAAAARDGRARGVCLGATCDINPGISPASQRENARYPALILIQHQRLYRGWGPGLCHG